MKGEDAGPPSDTSQILDRVVKEYFESRERGEEVDRDALVERHPQIAQELKRFFHSERRFESVTSLVPGVRIPDAFPDFEILDEIGRGGMGIVFRARQESLGRPVAFKVLRLERALEDRSQDAARRFALETEAVAGLDHPGIVPIHAVGETDGVSWFAMKLIDGENLGHHVGRCFEPREAARLVAKVADAIDHAHRRGVLHRDLKPANILVDRRGQPHVIDFGLAKVLGDQPANLTLSGMVLGTPRYLSPEQATDGAAAASVQSDIYSLGMILYTLLTGRPAFEGSTPVETLRKVVDTEPFPPARASSRVPRELDAICMKCLEKSPSRRYATAGELADDLQRFLTGRPVRARQYGAITLAVRTLRRRPWTAAALVLGGLLLATLAVGGLVYARREHQHVVALLSRDAVQRRYVHATEVRQAYEEWRVGNWMEARRRLTQLGETSADDGAGDLGFAWHHLDRVLREMPGTIRCTDLPVGRARQAYLTGGARFLCRLETDGRLTIWDLRAAEARELRQPLDATHGGLAVAVDRERIVVAGDDRVDVLDLNAEGIVLRRASLSAGAPYMPRAVSISGDGRVVAVAGLRGDIRVFDVESGGSAAVLDGGGRTDVATLSLDADGTLCVLGLRNGRAIELLDLAHGERRWLVTPQLAGKPEVRFSPDERRVIVRHGGRGTRFVVLDAHDGVVEGRLRSGRSAIDAFTADAVHDLLLAVSDGELIAWNLGTGERELSRVVSRQANRALSVAVGPNSGIVSVAGVDGTLRTWSLDSLYEPRIVRHHPETIWQAAVSGDGRWLVTGDDDYNVTLWEIDEGSDGRREIRAAVQSNLARHHRCGALAPDGSYLAGGGSDGTVNVFEGASPLSGEPFELTATWKGVAIVLDVAFSPRGDSLAVLSRKRLTVLDLDASGERLRLAPRFGLDVELPRGHVLWNMRISPDRRLLSMQWNDRRIRHVDLERGRFCGWTPVVSQETYSMVFSPDSRYLATGHSDGRVRVWKIAWEGGGAVSLVEHWQLFEHRGGVWSLAFLDNRTLASGSDDGTIIIWDLIDGPLGASGLGQAVLEQQVGGVKALASTSDGDLLISAGGTPQVGGEIRLWNGVSD